MRLGVFHFLWSKQLIFSNYGKSRLIRLRSEFWSSFSASLLLVGMADGDELGTMISWVIAPLAVVFFVVRLDKERLSRLNHS